ncbi:ArsR/SmtB family transcription factor [Thermodesulfobacteriota bacterium]
MNDTLHTPREKIADELVEILDSKFFKALSEPVRIQILKFLILNGRSDIAAIAKTLPQDRSVISRHLQFMHGVGILNCEKITRHVYYEINGVLFLTRLSNIMEKIKECMPDCCPVDTSG